MPLLPALNCGLQTTEYVRESVRRRDRLSGCKQSRPDEQPHDSLLSPCSVSTTKQGAELRLVTSLDSSPRRLQLIHPGELISVPVPLRRSIRAGPRFHGHDSHLQLVGVAQDGHKRVRSNRLFRELLVQVVHARNRLPIELDDDVSFSQPGSGCRAARFDRDNQQTALDRQMMIADQPAAQLYILPPNSDVTAPDFPILDQPARHVL